MTKEKIIPPGDIPPVDNHRIGMAKDRSQVLNTKTGKFTKRDSYSGQYLDQKFTGKSIKSIKGPGKKK